MAHQRWGDGWEPGLRIEYGDEVLRRLAHERDFLPAPMGVDVRSIYRRKLQCLDAAVDENDLHNVRSLRLAKLRGALNGHASIPLDDRFHLIVVVSTGADPKVEIIKLVDKNLKEVSR